MTDQTLSAEDLAEIRTRADNATGTSWHWAGNVDTDEPYLATWIPGAGRCQIFSIGHESRRSDDRKANDYRDYLRDCYEHTEEEIEDLVKESIEDPFGEPLRDPRLWFYTDLMAVDARKNVVYEVAPAATSRKDPAVYRADIVDIRHPDAQFIAHAREDVPRLLAEIDRLKGMLGG